MDKSFPCLARSKSHTPLSTRALAPRLPVISPCPNSKCRLMGVRERCRPLNSTSFRLIHHHHLPFCISLLYLPTPIFSSAIRPPGPPSFPALLELFHSAR